MKTRNRTVTTAGRRDSGSDSSTAPVPGRTARPATPHKGHTLCSAPDALQGGALNQGCFVQDHPGPIGKDSVPQEGYR